MTFKQGGILRSMTDAERHQQMDRIRDAIRLTDRRATPDEITKAAALLAERSSARQPELELKPI